MESRTTRKFRRLFSALPPDVQRDAKRAYRIFRTNPAHPGLQFKYRIGLGYLALAVMKKDSFIWYWIGAVSTTKSTTKIAGDEITSGTFTSLLPIPVLPLHLRGRHLPAAE
jgi:hypothetical protein